MIGERHLNYIVSEYVAHYHEERRRQGLGIELIGGTAEDENAGPEEAVGEVVCRERLGGLLKHYQWKAA